MAGTPSLAAAPGGAADATAPSAGSVPPPLGAPQSGGGRDGASPVPSKARETEPAHTVPKRASHAKVRWTLHRLVHAKGEFVKSAGKDANKKDGDSNQFVQGAIAAHRVGERQCLGCVVVRRIRAGQLLSGKVKYTAVCKALKKYDKVHTTPALRPSPPSQTTHTHSSTPIGGTH